ncbi:uncharacterized protein LOC128558964 [Mercenaria mercenaria]|uniref:uncharacterized protein LOC128558964 n=1 Tax=Mercenaria mercenaria TaxID=6596 RepID=UPI00234EB66E|nr:uncharacterized protein LOC128558964 [Mercenaria mercenaria]
MDIKEEYEEHASALTADKDEVKEETVSNIQLQEATCNLAHRGAPKDSFDKLTEVSKEGGDIEYETVGNLSSDHKNMTFISKTAEFVRSNLESTEAEEIAEAIYACVERIMCDVVKEEPRFRSSDIIKVGSFYEGTKILEPNEFDFLVVIDELSKPGAVSVVTEDIRPGYAEVLLIDDSLKQRWKHTDENCVLHNFQDYEHASSFGFVVLSTLAKLAEKQSLKYELQEVGYIYLPDTLISFPPTGNFSLELEYAEVWNPNVMLKFQCDKMTISVDISPAIRYHKVTDCFNPEDCIAEQLAEAVLNRGSILLVNSLDMLDKDPAHEHVFRITFTETEVQYVKCMEHGHKNIYVFMKYLTHVFKNNLKCQYKYHEDSKIELPSYLLKLACIFHDVQCSLPPSVYLNICLFKILLIFINWYQSGHYKSVFNTKLLVCKKSDMIVHRHRKMLDFLVDFCIHKVEAPDITQANFNPRPFLESKLREFYNSKYVSLENTRRKLLLPLAYCAVESLSNPEEVIRKVSSKTHRPSVLSFFSE